MKKLIYYAGLLFMAVWLFTIHSKFAFALDPLQNNDSGYYDKLFNFFGLDLKSILPYCWGAAFAIATSVIIALLKRSDKQFWIFAFSIASLELFGVMLFNYPEHGFIWSAISSVYYGIYAGIMVFLYIYISYDKQDDLQEIASQSNTEKVAEVQNDLDAKVLQLLNEGLRQSDIARRLKIPDYKVTRIKKKLENTGSKI